MPDSSTYRSLRTAHALACILWIALILCMRGLPMLILVPGHPLLEPLQVTLFLFLPLAPFISGKNQTLYTTLTLLISGLLCLIFTLLLFTFILQLPHIGPIKADPATKKLALQKALLTGTQIGLLTSPWLITLLRGIKHLGTQNHPPPPSPCSG